MAVAIYDESGARRDDFGHATTDSNGYFQLISDKLLVAKAENAQPGSEPVVLTVKVFHPSGKGEATVVVEALPDSVDLVQMTLDPLKPAGRTPPAKTGTSGVASKTASKSRPDLKRGAEALRHISGGGD